MLHGLLSQVLSPPHLHTAVLLTTAGELVSFASNPVRPKDEIRIIVGFCGEVWQETQEEGYGLVDSEVSTPLSCPLGFLAKRYPLAWPVGCAASRRLVRGVRKTLL